jgi:tetratricopeptide (TPR) repeat protein
VHNIVFDWWIAGGTLGLLAYLSIFAAAFWTLWKKGDFTVAERSILIGLLAGYFCHNFFVFDNITSYILFGMVLAYIVQRVSAADNTPALWFPSVPRGAAPVAALVAAAAAGGIVWWVNAGALAANQTILAGLSQQSGGLEQNLADFEQAISYNTYGNQEAREQLAQVATELSSASGVSTSTQEAFASTAVQQLELQSQVSPLDARFPLFEGVLLDAYGAYDQAQPVLERALSLSPTKQTIMFELGLNDEARGDTAGALSVFASAYNEETDNSEARIFYAAAAIRAGDDATADQVLAPIIPTGKAADPRITSAYVSRKEYGKLVTIWKAAVAVNPTNVQDYFTLAAAYYAEGDTTDAIATLTAAEKEDPTATTQADQLIQQIKNGTVQLQ